LGKKILKKIFSLRTKSKLKTLEKLFKPFLEKQGLEQDKLKSSTEQYKDLAVIGLLPTVLVSLLDLSHTALLQPGMTISIDPIKSLMKDQFEGLLKNGIDGAVLYQFISKSKTTKNCIRENQKSTNIFAFFP
jgi:ATP-dependent DNA helicase RecQ